MFQATVEDVVSLTQSTFFNLRFQTPSHQFAVLASFTLVDAATGTHKLISLATGAKCLPLERLSPTGDALHDSHAEVLARRGAVRWLLAEVGRAAAAAGDPAPPSSWLVRTHAQQWALRPTASVCLYVSMLPCGDASTRALAEQQDSAMAALKDQNAPSSAVPGRAARGRDGYTLLGVLRSKPGRADSPRTNCMSCSDKIALWNVCGIQGALGALLLEPIYISAIIIGDVAREAQSEAAVDCARAFYGRIYELKGLPAVYSLHAPEVVFTSSPFAHSRAAREPTATSSHESICWIADDANSPDVLVDGLRRGVTAKRRHLARSRPLLSKSSMYDIFRRGRALSGMPVGDDLTYYAAKQQSTDYKAAKQALMEGTGPFVRWLRSGQHLESFLPLICPKK